MDKGYILKETKGFEIKIDKPVSQKITFIVGDNQKISLWVTEEKNLIISSNIDFVVKPLAEKQVEIQPQINIFQNYEEKIDFSKIPIVEENTSVDFSDKQLEERHSPTRSMMTPKRKTKK